MLTQEQIKKLKPGDPLIVHGKFEGIDRDGDIIIEAKTTDSFSDEVVKDTKYFHISCVSMPPEKPIEIFHTTKIPEVYPKYDPCRKFRKGDMVRYCAPDGRIYADRGSLREHIKNRDLTHVVRDEQENGRVGVYDPLDEENPYYVPAHSLELVTPVEELEPYFVGESENSYDLFRRTDNGNQLRTSFWWKHNPYPEKLEMTEEEAKAVAEAECARLNEEYRKEQNNG